METDSGKQYKELSQQYATISSKYEDISSKYEKATSEIEELKQNELKLLKMLTSLRKGLYGRHTEKLSNLSDKQVILFDLEEYEDIHNEEKESGTKVSGYTRTNKHSRKDYSHLPVDRTEYEPEESHCSKCQCELVKIGEEITRQLERIPESVKIIEHVKIKKACPKCKGDKVKTGKLPPGVPVIPGSIAGASLLAGITVSKFVDHLPLYRQEKMFLRYGVDISRQRMSDWINQVAELLFPISETIRKEILKERYIHADETGIEVQDREKKKKLHKGYLWGLLGPPGVYFKYSKDRSSATAKELLSDYGGFLHCDAYAGYNSLMENCTRVGCWAHVRRKFIEVENVSGKDAGRILKLISKLYKVEKKARGLEDYSDVLAMRIKESEELIDKIKNHLENLTFSLLPKHPLKEAVDYALNQWTELVVFLKHGFVSLDNNAIENKIRPVAVGRKNWLFCGNHEGAKSSGVIYSIVGTCQMHGVNPLIYLTDVLKRVHSHPVNRISELLPQNWKKSFQ